MTRLLLFLALSTAGLLLAGVPTPPPVYGPFQPKAGAVVTVTNRGPLVVWLFAPSACYGCPMIHYVEASEDMTNWTTVLVWEGQGHFGDLWLPVIARAQDSPWPNVFPPKRYFRVASFTSGYGGVEGRKKP